MCGGVSFTISSLPSQVGNCYCRDCQRNAGGPYQTYAVCPADTMTIVDAEGLATLWQIRDTTSGIPKEKYFCSRCGCTLWTVVLASGRDRRCVRVSLIEDGLEKLKPTVELFTKNRPSGLPAMPNATQFERDST